MVTGTHHIGASTDQASEAIAEEVVRIIRAYKETGNRLTVSTSERRLPQHYNLVVRHYNQVGVFAGVLDELRNEGINIEEMENMIFEGGLAASCSLKLDDKPSAQNLKQDCSQVRI